MASEQEDEQQYVEFADFSGGDAGRMRPARNDLKFYRGTDTWTYPNGAIAPRPPWLALTYAGLPTGKTLSCFTTSVSGGGWVAWAFSDGTVYSTTPGSATAALRGTLTSGPTDALAVGDSILYVSSGGTGGGKVTSAGAFSAVTTPIADLLAQKGEQTLALHQDDGKLYWSDPTDPTSWPAANVEYVGDLSQALGIYVQRDTVVVPKINGELWLFTGTFGVNEVLRLVDLGLGHPIAGHAKGSVVGNSVLYYTSGSKMTAWTGAQFKTFYRPDMPAAAGFNSSPKTDNVGAVIGAGESNRFIVIGTMDNTATPTTRRPWFHSFSPEQGWNRHTFPAADYSIPASHLASLTSAESSRAIRASLYVNGLTLACRPSDAAGVTTLKHYLFFGRYETPYSVAVPMVGGPATALLDGDLTTPVIASFQSAEWWAPEGRDCFVRSLIFDYSYDTDAGIASALGGAASHRFDVTVDALQRDGSAYVASAVQQMSASGGSSVDGGSIYRSRFTLRFGDQGIGGGFRWNLADWRGIMIHRAVAVIDVMATRH